MVDGLPLVPVLNGLSVVAVVALVGWMLATGRLVTRREHATVTDDLRSQVAWWRSTWQTEAEAARTSSKVTDELLELARATNHALTSIQGLTSRGKVPP